MIKVKFEKGKELQKRLKDISDSISKVKGQNLDTNEMLPETKVADSDLKALYDALYKAKLEEDIDKIQLILDEVQKITEVDRSGIEEELKKRAIETFLKQIKK